ncbi:glycosyltransferase family 2 protein [Gammaproteobacteria bacterium]|nr:glycosyltransferase family 2 protein [Gammaproteobacteria bacterium]
MSVKNVADHRPLIGIAIASFNRKDLLKECLEAISNSSYQHIFICVVDDGSSDGTGEMLEVDFPSVDVINGDGNLWWAAATNQSIQRCLAVKCDYVVLLNDDCLLEADTLTKFFERAKEYPDAVITPLTMDIDNPDEVWWAGSSWGPLKYFPCIWLIRQKYPHRTPIKLLPTKPFSTSEFTGRGTFIPKAIFERVGFIDSDVFPQYGSDNDFSLRVTSSGAQAIVDPDNKVLLYVDEGGQSVSGGLMGLPVRFFKLMFFRRNGEAARYWWKLLKRHAPWYAVLPSYLFIMMLIFLRAFKLLPFIYKLTGAKSSI